MICIKGWWTTMEFTAADMEYTLPYSTTSSRYMVCTAGIYIYWAGVYSAMLILHLADIWSALQVHTYIEMEYTLPCSTSLADIWSALQVYIYILSWSILCPALLHLADIWSALQETYIELDYTLPCSTTSSRYMVCTAGIYIHKTGVYSALLYCI